MQTYFHNHRRAVAAIPLVAVMVGALTMTALLPTAVEAQGFGFRAAGASGENGAVANSRGVISNGPGTGAIRSSSAISDDQGNGATVSGGCAWNLNAVGCTGHAANWESDGSFSGVAGAEIAGQNGFYSANRSLDRDAGGNWSGASAVDASGLNGGYSGSATLEDGNYSRGATYVGVEGQTAKVEGSYEPDNGGSRSVTCINASGEVVECP